MSPRAHRSPSEYSCAGDRDDYKLAVTLSWFCMLFGNISSAGKLNFMGCFNFGKPLWFGNRT